MNLNLFATCLKTFILVIKENLTSYPNFSMYCKHRKFAWRVTKEGREMQEVGSSKVSSNSFVTFEVCSSDWKKFYLLINQYF